jgi:hypothetical protein
MVASAMPPTKKKPPARADLGAPVDGWFAKQPAALRPIVDTLRALIDQTIPKATSSVKWGNAFYELDGAIICAISAHKAHVNLILSGTPDTFVDPKGRLTGAGKTGRHLKLTSLDELPKADVVKWLKASVRARG